MVGTGEVAEIGAEAYSNGGQSLYLAKKRTSKILTAATALIWIKKWSGG
jgi:hypothetical protein